LVQVPDAAGWHELVLKLADGTSFDLDYVSGSIHADLFEEELEEFREFAVDADGTDQARQQVLSHLDDTKAIVAIEVPASVSQVALPVASQLLRAISETCDGLVQADGEGFYRHDDADLLLPVA